MTTKFPAFTIVTPDRNRNTMGLSLRRRAKALSDRPTASKQNGAGCLIAFGLVFGCFGSIFVVMFFLLPLMRALDADTWVEIPCTILESRVGESRDDDGTTYRVEVRYEYHFRPGDLESDPTAPRYESERYDFFEGIYSSGAETKRAEVQRLAPGTHTTCRVDPSAPDQAVLKAGFPDGLWFMLFTLLFPLVGFALAVTGIVSVIRGKRQPTSSAAMSHGASSTALPLVVEDTSGPVELQQAQGRFAKLALIGLFAAFWNGITWTIIGVAIIPDILRGDWLAWFPLLFVSIFAIIGLALIGLVIHQALALTNPRLRLIVNRQVFRPGDLLELEWECSGNPSRITRMTIALEGRESATYTRGTDTTTENHVFARLPLATLDDAVAILSGRVKLLLPKDTVPTFIASHNKLEWQLTVRGMIPRWPDISDDYQVTILPQKNTP